MSTLNYFIIFQCDTCKRQMELQIDGSRIDPIRCIITYKCRGKLSRVGQSAVKTFLVTPPVPGLEDYIPRGTVISAPPVIAPVPNISLNTGGGAGMLSIGILKRIPSSPSVGSHQFSVLAADGITPIIVDTEIDAIELPQNVSILLNIFPISPSVLESTTYTYLESGEVQVISGPDNSPSPIVLRFTAQNNISVYSNGVELDPSEYIISVPNQSITLTPAIYESNNVINVVVYNNLTANAATSSVINLEFNVLDPAINLPPPGVSDVAFLSTCSWGNCASVKIGGVERYLMHCTDLSALSSNVSYGIVGAQVVIGAPVPVGYFIPGTVYTIITTGDTNFVPLGAANSSPGTVFTAISAGTPDPAGGTATPTVPIDIDLSEVNFVIGKDPFDFQDKELNAYLNGISFTDSFTFTFTQNSLTGIYSLTAPQSTFSSLLNSMLPAELFSSTLYPLLYAEQTTGGATTAAPTIAHKYIIGPT